MSKYYKFLKLDNGKIKSAHGDQTWEIGKEYTVKGKIEACSNGFHCSKEPIDALGYVQGEVLAIVSGAGDSIEKGDKSVFQKMTIEKAYNWTKSDSVSLAIYSAELVVKIFEQKYPFDSRPRDAIKAAKSYLKNPNKKSAHAAVDAADAADAAAYAAHAAADAAYAAADAAYAAVDAAHAAYAAVDAAYAAVDAAHAAYAAHAAAYAAYAAVDAAHAAADAAEITTKINRWIKNRIKKSEQL